MADERKRLLGANLAIAAFLGIAALFLLGEHRLHALGALAWLLLAAVLLLSRFLHRGHGRDRRPTEGDRR